jgi:phi13 family phage major tail protein
MLEAHKYEEYQGFDSLYYAEITKDDATGFTAGTPAILAPAGEISVSTENASAIRYYDNQAWAVVSSEGAETVNLVVPILPAALKGLLTGKVVDTVTGAVFDTGEPETKYFAIGYRLRFTDGSYRYVWRHKGTFRIDSEEAKTKDNSTDTNNQTLIFTGMNTKFRFDMPDGKKKPSKQIVVDERDEKADVTNWFTTVITPETIVPLVE